MTPDAVPPAPAGPHAVRVPPGAVAALRQRVLRPHQQLAELTTYPAGARCLAVLDATGRPQATGTLLPTAPPWPAPVSDHWRLVAMATEPASRGLGLGRVVLSAALAEVAAASGSALWCSARIPALGFYLRAGFQLAGLPWVDDWLGPHVHLRRSVT